MTKLMTTIHDLSTGEITTRQMTLEEIANLENVQAEHQAAIDVKNKEAVAKEALLERLGITAEEAALLLG